MNNKIILIVGILVTIGASILFSNYSSSESTPVQVLQGAYSNTPLNFLIGQDINGIKIPLTQIVADNNASGNLPYENRPMIIYDHNVTLSLYKGTTINGTIIAVQATNVGSNDVEIEDMGLKGAIQQGIEYTTIIDKHIIGCTGDTAFDENTETVYSNGTHITKKVPTTVHCKQIAVHDPLLLKPGKSMTAYIITNMNKGSVTINQFTAYINYLNGSNMYGMFLPLQTIS